MSKDQDQSAPDWVELRPAADGTFDEILATFADGKVHVETLDDKSVYIGIYKGEGPQTHGLQLWINSNGVLRYSHAAMSPAPAPHEEQGS